MICKCLQQTEYWSEPKTENDKTFPSQAPIMEAKQLYLQIHDRSFLMESPEIVSTVTLQKAGWFNKEIFNKKTINDILFWALTQYFTDPQVLR